MNDAERWDLLKYLRRIKAKIPQIEKIHFEDDELDYLINLIEKEYKEDKYAENVIKAFIPKGTKYERINI